MTIKVAISTIVLMVVILGMYLLPYVSVAASQEQLQKMKSTTPRPYHENDHLYFEYVGTVTRLIPIIIVNSPPKGSAEGRSNFVAMFSYSFRNNFIDIQKITTNSLIFDVKAINGGVAGVFAKVKLDIYRVYVCNYINPSGCEYRDTIAEVSKIIGYFSRTIVRKTTDQTFLPTQIFANGVPSVKFDVRYKETDDNKYVSTVGYSQKLLITIQSATIITISTGFFYDGEYLHGSLKSTYGNTVIREITYTFPPGCLWEVHPLGKGITSAWSFKLLRCTNSG